MEFVEIDWDNKILELENKSIDVVWNGMTLTSEVTNLPLFPLLAALAHRYSLAISGGVCQKSVPGGASPEE